MLHPVRHLVLRDAGGNLFVFRFLQGQLVEIGADAVIYQDLDALKAAVRAVNPKLTQFETSCFDGVYITGDVTSEYLASVERQRDAGRQEGEEEAENNQLDLNAV